MKNKTIIWGGGIALALIGIYLYRRNLQRGSSYISNLQDYKTYGGEYDKPLFPLKRGSGFSNEKHKETVKKLQRYLNSKTNILMPKLEIDGLFGEKTESALNRIEGKKEVSEKSFNDMMKDKDYLTSSNLF